jgi:hypothetical protein
MAPKSKPAARKVPKPPKPDLVTGDLGPVAKPGAAKPKPAPVVVSEPAPSVPTTRAFGDPAPPAPEPVVVSSPDGPVHRAPCDPPSRT